MNVLINISNSNEQHLINTLVEGIKTILHTDLNDDQEKYNTIYKEAEIFSKEEARRCLTTNSFEEILSSKGFINIVNFFVIIKLYHKINGFYKVLDEILIDINEFTDHEQIVSLIYKFINHK